MLKEKLVSGLYLLQGNTLVGTIATVSEENQSQASLWHKRLGHISEGGLRELSKQKLLEKTTLKHWRFVNTTSLGKQKG